MKCMPHYFWKSLDVQCLHDILQLCWWNCNTPICQVAPMLQHSFSISITILGWVSCLLILLCIQTLSLTKNYAVWEKRWTAKTVAVHQHRDISCGKSFAALQAACTIASLGKFKLPNFSKVTAAWEILQNSSPGFIPLWNHHGEMNTWNSPWDSMWNTPWIFHANKCQFYDSNCMETPQDFVCNTQWNFHATWAKVCENSMETPNEDSMEFPRRPHG